MSGIARVKEFLANWANRGECSLKKGSRILPPRGIFDHLGWGWEMLALWCGGSDWAPYKNYLKQYCCLNRPESVAQAWQDEKSRDSNVLTPLGSRETYAAGNGIRDGDGLVPFVSWCVKMEKQCIVEYEWQGEAYGRSHFE